MLSLFITSFWPPIIVNRCTAVATRLRPCYTHSSIHLRGYAIKIVNFRLRELQGLSPFIRTITGVPLILVPIQQKACMPKSVLPIFFSACARDIFIFVYYNTACVPHELHMHTHIQAQKKLRAYVSLLRVMLYMQVQCV